MVNGGCYHNKCRGRCGLPYMIVSKKQAALELIICLREQGFILDDRIFSYAQRLRQ